MGSRSGQVMTLRQLRLPPLHGDSAVTLEHWYKQSGDRVTVGDPLVLFSTYYPALDLPAPLPGTLTQTSYASGDTIQVRTPLATIQQLDSTLIDHPTPLAAQNRPPRIHVSPLARKLATVHGYDLTA